MGTPWTKGPWWANTSEDQPVPMYAGLVAYISLNPPITVCAGAAGDKNGPIVSPEEWPANARLIAAAPEMAEGYETVCDLLQLYLDTFGEIDPDNRNVHAELNGPDGHFALLSKIKGETDQ